MKKLTAIIIGINSDIGLSIGRHFVSKGMEVFGTYRSRSSELETFSEKLSGMFECNFSSKDSVDKCITALIQRKITWDFLIICPGTMNPIGRFDRCNIDEWEEGLRVNLTMPLRMFHGLYLLRKNSQLLPLVVFFSGGGSNSAPINYSSYITSKIGLTKATELLDAEFEDVKFSIIGPGWVKTKIHDETLKSRANSVNSAIETERRLRENEFNPMPKVLDFFDWLIVSPKKIIGGRNFSIVHDQYLATSLKNRLEENKDLYKLRRHGN